MITHDISVWLFGQLMADEGVTSIVGDRIYPVCSKADIAYPFVMFDNVRAQYEQGKDGSYPVSGSVTLYCASSTLTGAEQLAQEVCNAVDNGTIVTLDADCYVSEVSNYYSMDSNAFVFEITLIINL